ncbi:NADPH:quinone oxidoreductase family protein [Tateyamaria omphalii]|uniref:NADPH:quinone oxidoreductase n=1 Tax=Tateyamaria omphalii TaxID=299262 RepID=A0A1P8MTX6_9RHOB|nr:NADPH:quinone oxidoreductase family protein [Tateyamaria omphalii]APX11481.1 NADPH:quinone oxidoreductase [Tateyamaria omphalii]
MHAMLSTAPGGPETLEWTEGPSPAPKKGEVRIAVKAAGVNFPDTLIIRDLYQVKPPRPFAPGGEVAGVVDAVGDGVTTLAAGDRVLAMTGFGGFTTHLCAQATACVKIPDDMPFEDAACFIFTYGTSHYALKNRAELKSGETLLILGAAGGVGAAAIELGKAAGARVIAAVSSQEKADFCRTLGADETIVYAREMDRDAQKALSAEIKKIAGPDGVHVAYDAVGGDYAEPVIRSMAWGGRFLVVGFPAGIPAIPLNLTLLKSCQIVGVFWGASIYRDPAGHMQNVSDLFEMYAQGKVKPRISASFPMQEAAKALTLIADRKVLGKVVLTNP